MTTSIKVENLSKIYRLGQIGTGTISQDVQRWFTTKVLGKEDPFLKIGQSNDRTTKGVSDIVYSLQDINFEIEQGDAVGIIGRNGAGKSTLLKILSRVTAPTTGRINVKGRVASLLEVGTGFHPELTGRENIYLNGAILGMRKKEITRKLDEIIDFSGVERYIDTPVKRYSSGMYVRLAFAVAAHLESEILIVDEVLAVGDAEFQKKCLGKMGDVSKGEGRTVLFVSHNMEAVASLCERVITLKNGGLDFDGQAVVGISNYLHKTNLKASLTIIDNNNFDRAGDRDMAELLEFHILDSTKNYCTNFEYNDRITFKVKAKLNIDCNNVEVGIAISNLKGQRFHHIVSAWNSQIRDLTKGEHLINVTTDPIKLYPGEYNLSIWIRDLTNNSSSDFIENISSIIVNRNINQINKQIDRFSTNGGVILDCKWSIEY